MLHANSKETTWILLVLSHSPTLPELASSCHPVSLILVLPTLTAIVLSVRKKKITFSLSFIYLPKLFFFKHEDVNVII